MFGLGRHGGTRRTRGASGERHLLRNAALAGLGMLAFRWLRNRRHDGPTEPRDAW